VTTHIFRVIVRGRFDELEMPARSKLLAELDEHEPANASFTTAGTITYDAGLSAFALRFEVRERGDDSEATAAAAEVTALAKARAWLDEAGLSHKGLRVTTIDMAAIWRRRGK
jgi:hypothetical protein